MSGNPVVVNQGGADQTAVAQPGEPAATETAATETAATETTETDAPTAVKPPGVVTVPS